MAGNVERLGVSDLDDLIELEKLCFAYHWTREQFLMGLEKGIYVILGVRKGEGLGGYLALSFVHDEMEILNLAVHPDARRNGLGTALMKAGFNMCIERGIAKSFLDVKCSNQPAIDLYTKFGYKKIGVRKKYYPDTKEDALLFRRDFT